MITMIELASESDIPRNFTSQISETLNWGDLPCDSGSFGVVYRRTIKSSEGTMEVAVKTFKIDPRRATDKLDKGIRRELRVWLKLKHPTIVPLLGIAIVLDSRFPALVSLWMSSGTLYTYLEQQGTITASAQVELAKGVADGLEYLHSENVVHGDLHPGNVLIDDLGHPRLTDFGLATVVGDVELQLNTTTAGRNFNPQWRAPEVIGIDSDPVRPNFKSDVYSLGSVKFYILSGFAPWKEKKAPQIIIELVKKATPARPHNILDDHWNLIQKCWSWDPVDRPDASEVVRFIAITNTTLFGESGMAKGSLQAGGQAANIPSDDDLLDDDLDDDQTIRNHSVPSTGGITFQQLFIYTPSPSNRSGPTPPKSQTLRNVVIIGQSGAGKSSLINMLCPGANDPTSNDTTGCTRVEKVYRCDLGQQQYCQVHDTVGLEEGRWGFLPDKPAQKQLKAYLAMMMKRTPSELDLLVYCMPGTRGLKTSHHRNFNNLKQEGNVPIVVVVTHLEDFTGPLENWWSENATTLKDVGIPNSTKHACVTTRPKHELDRSHLYLYDQSCENVKALIRNNLPRIR